MGQLGPFSLPVLHMVGPGSPESLGAGQGGCAIRDSALKRGFLPQWAGGDHWVALSPAPGVSLSLEVCPFSQGSPALGGLSPGWEDCRRVQTSSGPLFRKPHPCSSPLLFSDPSQGLAHQFSPGDPPNCVWGVAALWGLCPCFCPGAQSPTPVDAPCHVEFLAAWEQTFPVMSVSTCHLPRPAGPQGVLAG